MPAGEDPVPKLVAIFAALPKLILCARWRTTRENEIDARVAEEK
jgi:hypothetical protein